MSTFTGHPAILHAAKYGRTLNKYADPTEPARDGLTVEEARAVAEQDSGLLWIETTKAEEGAERMEAARRWLGDAAPADVVEAKARCYAWRPFRGLLAGPGYTEEERAAHAADVALVEGYVAALPGPHMGANPMGDE